MPLEQVVALQYTRHALSVALVPLTKAFSFGEDQSVIDWGLGRDKLFCYHDREAYWDVVQCKIQEIQKTATGWERGPITQVLLLEESVLDLRFLDTLQDALDDIQAWKTDGPQITTAGCDPLFTAAKGAAEFAKRLQEAPRDCV